MKTATTSDSGLIKDVLCLEGDWDAEGEMNSRLTVEDMLRLLTQLGAVGDYVHRDVATLKEFEHYLGRVRTSPRFGVAYLAFHGSRKGFWLDDETSVTLDQLAGEEAGAFTGVAVHLGSCSVLARDSDRLKAFCQHTGARSISGYVRNVDWLTSAMLDMALLAELAAATPTSTAYRRLAKQHPWLVSKLGLRMVTQRWDSRAHS